MITTMNMSSYEIEQDEKEIEYDEEIMNAGWNPAVDLISEQLLQVQIDEQMPIAVQHVTKNTPDDVSSAVSELFRRKMYSYWH